MYKEVRSGLVRSSPYQKISEKRGKRGNPLACEFGSMALMYTSQQGIKQSVNNVSSSSSSSTSGDGDGKIKKRKMNQSMNRGRSSNNKGSTSAAAGGGKKLGGGGGPPRGARSRRLDDYSAGYDMDDRPMGGGGGKENVVDKRFFDSKSIQYQ